MYDTKKRVALVKQRMAVHRRRQTLQRVHRLSTLCVLLFLSLIGTVGMMVQGQPMDAVGMYGAILLHEGVGGYVLVAVISFTAAVVITAVCISFRKREQPGQDTEKEQLPQHKEAKRQ